MTRMEVLPWSLAVWIDRSVIVRVAKVHVLIDSGSKCIGASNDGSIAL